MLGRFSGEEVDGVRHGDGKVEWLNGDVYEGRFRNGLREGEGTLAYANGRKYQGEWRGSKREGRGVETLSNGTKYIGEFKGNVRAVVGRPWPPVGGRRCRRLSASVRQRYHGRGVLLSHGGRYEGTFKNGKKDGAGTMRWNNGDVYEGEWREGLMSGSGKYVRARDNAVYEGLFRDHQRHGRGTETLSTGERYQGTWEANQKHGALQYRDTNGRVRQGLWERDVRIKWLTQERYGADGKRLRMKRPPKSGK